MRLTPLITTIVMVVTVVTHIEKIVGGRFDINGTHDFQRCHNVNTWPQSDVNEKTGIQYIRKNHNSRNDPFFHNDHHNHGKSKMDVEVNHNCHDQKRHDTHTMRLH